MSFLKYVNEEGSSPVARTADGYPIRGGVNPFLRQEEEEELSPSFDARCRVFDLSDPEHLKQYTEVLDKIANGAWIPLAPDQTIENSSKTGWIVLCRWAEVKAEIPQNIKNRLGL